LNVDDSIRVSFFSTPTALIFHLVYKEITGNVILLPKH
jgi:hypothetical protein